MSHDYDCLEELEIFYFIQYMNHHTNEYIDKIIELRQRCMVLLAILLLLVLNTFIQDSAKRSP